MLHASTEQPYPSTQHESGVQPQCQLWEQPRYEPRSGLSSTRWVPVGADSQSRAPCPAPSACPTHCEAEWPAVPPLLSLWSFLLSFLFPSSPLLPSSACLNFGSFHFLHMGGKKHHFTLYCCHLWPLASSKPVCVVASNLRGRLAKACCFWKVELIQRFSFVIEFWQFVFNFTKGQDIRDSVQRWEKIKSWECVGNEMCSSLGVIMLI